MANSVTFPEALGGNGQTYTDDADTATGLDGLGYTVRFIPCLQQAVAMGLSAQSNAEAAAGYVEQCQTLRNEVATDRQAVAEDRTHVNQQKGLVDTAAGQVVTDRQAVADDRTYIDQQKTGIDTAAEQVTTDRQAVAGDRSHIDQQKTAVDTVVGQVATDRQAVSDDRLASHQAAVAAGDAADASIIARNQSEALYGDLNAVETAKTEAQQAAIDAEAALSKLNTQAVKGERRTGIEIIAHRGFRHANVQNTLVALTRCVTQGADSVEFDVQVSADGTPWVFHDATVDALTDGTGTFTSLDDATIALLRYTQADGTQLEGIGIPRLDTVLREMRRLRVRIYPEIKGLVNPEADIATMVAAVRAHDLSDITLWQSFTFSDLETVNALDDVCAVGYLVSGQQLPELETAIDDVAMLLDRGWLLSKFDNYVTHPEIVGYARSKGVSLGAWTVNNTIDMQALNDIGVYHLMTDYNLKRIGV